LIYIHTYTLVTPLTGLCIGSGELQWLYAHSTAPVNTALCHRHPQFGCSGSGQI